MSDVVHEAGGVHGDGAARRSVWRFFPWFLVGALGLVIGVNILMAVLAHRSAPGLAVQGSFATSNAYGRIQQESRRQATLGWSLDVQLRDGALEVLVTGPDGAALPEARLEAIASRPLGDHPATVLPFASTDGMAFRAGASLPAPGQWDVRFEVASQGRSLRHTRRIMIP